MPNDPAPYISKQSLVQRQSAKEGGRRGRYQDVREITLQSVRDDALAANLATEVLWSLSAGKEATVYTARWHDFPLALKAFRFHSTSHRKHGKLGFARDLMSQWAAREFWILDRLFRAGAKVPTPARQCDHMFTARFLGENLTPAPLLKDCVLEYPQRTFDSIIEQVFLLYRTFVIHGDLSAFNVLMFQGEPWLIDFPQAIDFASRPSRRQVLKDGRSILLRDLTNIVDYFQRLGIRADVETLCDECMSQIRPEDRFEPHRLAR